MQDNHSTVTDEQAREIIEEVAHAKPYFPPAWTTVRRPVAVLDVHLAKARAYAAYLGGD